MRCRNGQTDMSIAIDAEDLAKLGEEQTSKVESGKPGYDHKLLCHWYRRSKSEPWESKRECCDDGKAQLGLLTRKKHLSSWQRSL
jgi:hypothetical protein